MKYVLLTKKDIYTKINKDYTIFRYTYLVKYHIYIDINKISIKDINYKSLWKLKFK